MFGKSGIDYLRNLGKYKWNFHKYVKINITKKRSNSKKKSNEKSKMKKEDLIKATIRTMGYARSSNVLTSAVERGLKYGRKTGEIVEVGEKNVFEVRSIPERIRL